MWSSTICLSTIPLDEESQKKSRYVLQKMMTLRRIISKQVKVKAIMGTGAREMARVLVSLLEDPSSVPSTDTVARTIWNS